MGKFRTPRQLLFRFSRTLVAKFGFNSEQLVSQNEKVSHMLKNFLNDENGFIISAELALVLTIAVIGIVVGLSHVAMAINQELSDVASAIGSLDQSFNFTGYTCCKKNGVATAASAGSWFNDTSDDCDCSTSCDLIGPTTPTGTKSGG